MYKINEKTNSTFSGKLHTFKSYLEFLKKVINKSPHISAEEINMPLSHIVNSKQNCHRNKIPIKQNNTVIIILVSYYNSTSLSTQI